VEHYVIQLAGLIVLGVGATWLSWRLRVPSILLLLIVGFLAGPATGILQPDNLLGDLLFPMVSLSVAIILFEGGLSLDIDELRDIGRVVRNLMTVGVLITWVGATGLAYLLLGFDLGLATLLGAILVVTGPTVIIPLMRHVRPSARVGSAIRWEGIVNDPIGAILAVLVFEVIVASGGQYVSGAAVGVAKAIGAGVGSGLIGAGALIFPLKRYWIPDFLQNPAALAVALTTFTVSNTLQGESGLLAVTVMGSALASQKLVSVRHIVEFKENLRVLLISVLFIVLAARVPMSAVTSTSWSGLAFLAGLILLVRPLSVVIATWRTELEWQERTFLALMAPRGIVAAAVTSIFALELGHVGYPAAERLIPVTFLVIVGTVVVYGLSAAPVARRLGVASPNPQGLLLVGAAKWVRSLAELLTDQGFRVLLVDSNWAHVTAARRAGLSAHYGNILAEQAMDELKLDGLGRILAMTPNDEVNALGTLHFAELFGRSNVFQLAPRGRRTDGSDPTMPSHLRGRFLFASEATHQTIAARVAAGAVFKRTTLSNEFGFDDFQSRHGDTALPLFVSKGPGELEIIAAESSWSPKAGHTLISLVGPDSGTPISDTKETNDAN
jgi:NhaP-type Na+/H+ or K+/H+ antiporter